MCHGMPSGTLFETTLPAFLNLGTADPAKLRESIDTSKDMTTSEGGNQSGGSGWTGKMVTSSQPVKLVWASQSYRH